MEINDFKPKMCNDFYFEEIQQILESNAKIVQEKNQIITLSEEQKIFLKSLKLSLIQCIFQISTLQQLQYSFLTPLFAKLLPLIYKFAVIQF